MMTLKLKDLANLTNDSFTVIAPHFGKAETKYRVDYDADPDRAGNYREFADLPDDIQNAEVEHMSVNSMTRELNIYLYRD